MARQGEKRLELDRGDEVLAGKSNAELREFVRDLEPGSYLVRRSHHGQPNRPQSRIYVRLKPEVLAARARDRREPIGGFVRAPFFKKKTG